MSRGSVRVVFTVVVIPIACAGVIAQRNSNAPPWWAYGIPQAGAAADGSQAGAAPDAAPKRVPGSNQAFTVAQLRDFFNVADWFPEDHPAMPDVVAHGRSPDVRGCGMCHMPNGKGRPENAPVAGLSYDYIIQQLDDFKNDLRTSADSRKTNTGLMVQAAKAMTDAERKDAATYFSSMKWTPWIKVVESARVPKTRLSGNVFIPLPGTATEPLGRRIVEAPVDAARFELRDPHSGFIAYVPPRSLAKGAALVAGGGAGKTYVCSMCHGADLNGLGPVPGIAGRSPSYLMRQLYDFQQGTRKGRWSPLMTQVVAKLTQDDMLAIVAYLAGR